MASLVCRSCGLRVYTTAPLESLFVEERLCRRCGAQLNEDRRKADRRQGVRRENPPDDPGPPPEGERRRLPDRRSGTPRREQS